MWPKVAAASVLLLLQGGVSAQDCAYTVSVLDVAGVQCVSSAPCSGTYYASGLSQGVGACPSGTSCALLPETPIMGCAASGRTDLIYVNADGTLTKDGKSVTLPGTTSTTTAPTSSTSSSSKSTSSSSKSTSSSSKSTSSSSQSTGSSSKSTSSSSTTSSLNGSNASSGSSTSSTDGGSDASNATTDSSSSNVATTTNSSTSQSWASESGSGNNTISPGSSSANQQAEFNPGSILSDGSNKSKSSSDGGLSLGAIIAIVVGCLAVVAIAAGARLLKKGKEAELETPEGALEGYNGGGGGGGGMTPKENVLLL